MSSRRPLSEKQLSGIAERMFVDESDSEEDPFHDSDDSDDEDYRDGSENSSDYSHDEDSGSEESETDSEQNNMESERTEQNNMESETTEQNTMESEITEGTNNQEREDTTKIPSSSAGKYIWNKNLLTFSPKRNIPIEENPVIIANLNRGSTMLECFYQLFPKSLITQISYYTNLRLDILEKTKKKPIKKTSAGEIKIILGCSLIMSYNRVPAIHMYWSRNKSLGNPAIIEAISRDRFMLLLSKLYLNYPEKPENASKIYYMEEVLSCLKHTFIKTRTDSTFQAIDESMTKFKGRSSLKQYLPLKPIKRGIKLWTRCDSKTGYVYDTNIYCGKDNEVSEGTLGERVVLKLAETIRNPNVAICFDRFFCSTILLDSIGYSAVGTYISSRKNTPKLESKLVERGACEMAGCKEGILAIKWKDTKDVLVMSNCHMPIIEKTKRKMKDGTSKELECPEAIIFYNKHMGGVDHADQMSTLYELDRRSTKWWKKVFFRLLMVALCNAHIVYQELTKKKIPFIDFVVNVAEGLISEGRSQTDNKRSRRQGRTSKRVKHCENIGDHLPIDKGGRNRCIRCKSRKIEKRTKIICKKCQVPLCVNCFTPYHT